MDREELLRQILYRQHITAPADRLTVCRDLNGLQAQFLSNALHGLRIRCSEPLREGGWGEELVKSWSVRGTMHVFAESDLPLFLHEGRTHFLRPQDTMEADEWITKERKQYFAEKILKLVGDGTGDRDALKAACLAAGLTAQEAQSVFDPWGGTLRALAEGGKLCYRVQQKKTFRLCPAFSPMPRPAAELEKARRYFAHFGPAAVRDAAYYFGVSQARVKAWMRQLPLTGMSVGGEQRYVLESGEGGQTNLPAVPGCVFLAGFDQLLLGYQKQESPFLPPEYLREIFSPAGIVMPALLLNGRVAGRWKRNGKGTVQVTRFRALTSCEEEDLRRCAAQTFPEMKRLELL